MANKKQAPKNDQPEQEKDTMINIGGLWANVSKKGELYFTGYLNGARLLILPNNFKEKDSHPDYVMNVLPHKASESNSDTQSALDAAKKKAAQKKDDFQNDPPF